MSTGANTTLLAEEHTPGPWRVDPTHRLCIESAAHGNIGLVNIARSSEADARLIAAAPDLLETAKVWLRLHEQGMVSREAATELWSSGQIPRAMEALRAAIVKATARGH